jgi:lysylphosphatidylglycerol synthetase-like protein (DUF2156 family)
MTTTTTTPSPARAARRDPLLTGIRVLLGLFGAFKLYGTAYFTFFATAEQGGDPQGVVDWLVVTWSTALALALLVAAFGLRTADRRIVGVTVGLLLVEIAFSFVKLFAYDEIEALGFMAVDLVVVALLALAVRRKSGASRS